MGKFLTYCRKSEDGSTAIEFSLLFIPYLFLTLGIIELSLMYTSATLLDGATSSASRMIRTGQVQQSGSDNPEQLFRDAICAYATVLINCNEVLIEVIPMDSYADFDGMAPQFDGDGNFVPQGFDAGASNGRVLIRTVYTYSMFTPLVGPLLNGPDNQRTFISTIVLQSEPYEFGGA